MGCNHSTVGCNHSTVSNSEVLWRCKKRKRMMSDAVKFRQEFAAAQLAYIQTLKQVGHALPQYANRQLPNTEAIPAEKKGEATTESPPPSSNPSPATPTKPQPSPSHTQQLNVPPQSSTPSPKQAPSSDANHLQPSKSAPLTGDRKVAMPNGVSSAAIQSRLRQYSDDVPVFSMPSSPMVSSYYSFSQPSSPQSSAWDPFSLFSTSPFRSPEPPFRRLQDWDPDREISAHAGLEGLPDLEEVEADTGQKVDVNDSKKIGGEQNHGKVNTMESLGKPEKKQIQPPVEKMLSKIDEDSAEEAASPTKDIKPNADTKAEGRKSDRNKEVKDVTSYVNQIIECVKRITDAFESALESGNEVSQMLEAQIVYPRARLRDLSDSFRTGSSISRQWSWRSSSRRVDLYDTDDDLENDIFGSHSLTLERLYTWEKKLYREVKVGEKLHIAFLRKSREFHSIDGKGKDPDLIEQCRSEMKSLESQLVVAFRAISSVSLRIQQVSYKELYPQLIELLRRLTIMWKAMFECHTTQKQAALEILSIEKLAHHKIAANDDHRNAAMQLEKQLEAWQRCFYLWVISQQRYIDTLLTWIKICYMEPESNPRRGAASPAWTMGKTPIYMLARNWHDSLLCLEENTEVVDAIGKFAGAIHDVQVTEGEELVQLKRAEMTSRSMDYRSRKVIEYSKEQEKSSEGEDAVLASLKMHLPSIFDALTTFSSVAFREYEKLHNEADIGVAR